MGSVSLVDLVKKKKGDCSLLSVWVKSAASLKQANVKCGLSRKKEDTAKQIYSIVKAGYFSVIC